VRRRRDVAEVELGDLRDSRDDVVQLRAEALELVLAELEPGEVRDVEQLFAGDLGHRRESLSETERGPCRGLFHTWVPAAL
jgi:hypothetical protein